MASRKRLASWSTALSEQREARKEAEDEQLAAERQVDELQDQIAEVEAERDLEEALEQLQTAEELTDSLKAELQALRGGESARKRASPECIVIVCFFDVHEFHGNTEIQGKGTFERISIVCYYRKNMVYCKSALEEMEIAKRLKNRANLNK